MLAGITDNTVLVEALLILRVNSEVVESQLELEQLIEDVVATNSPLDLLLQQLVRNLLSSLVMVGHTLQNILIPGPVLQHLTWELDKVTLAGRSTEPRIVGLAKNRVHNVTKLVEESAHI